jgi:hypothetical protein
MRWACASNAIAAARDINSLRLTSLSPSGWRIMAGADGTKGVAFLTGATYSATTVPVMVAAPLRASASFRTERSRVC